MTSCVDVSVAEVVGINILAAFSVGFWGSSDKVYDDLRTEERNRYSGGYLSSINQPWSLVWQI